MRKKNLLLAALALAPILLSTEAALAWVPIASSEPVWANLPFPYRINQNSIPSSIASSGVASIDASWAQWSTPGCTSFTSQNLGNTTSGASISDGQNILRWISSNWPSMYGPVNGVIGVTLPFYQGTGDITDADISFNNVGFCWNNTGTGGCVDTKSIATHEIGHALGLGHTTVQGSTMEAAYSGGTSIATIEQDDIAGVCALYPATGTTSASSSSASSSSAVSSSSSGGNQTCEECTMDQSNGACASQYNACTSSQQCINFYNCAMGCGGNQTCVQNCATMYPTGAQTYQTFVQCICGVCTTPCAMVCGGGASSSSAVASSSSAGPASGATTGTGAGVGGNGSSSSGGWGGEGGEGGGAANPNNESEGGCACNVQSSGIGTGALLFAAALGAAATRRRRPRRESRR